MPKLKYRSKLPRPDDPDIYEPICQAIAIGMPQAQAAFNAGVHEDTLYHWRYQGQAQLAQAEGRWMPWNELGSHAQLVIRIKEAEAGLVEDALLRWREGGKDWPAWATLLERRFPQEFGRRMATTVEQRTLSITVTAELPPAAQSAILAYLQQNYAPPTPLLIEGEGVPGTSPGGEPPPPTSDAP